MLQQKIHSFTADKRIHNSLTKYVASCIQTKYSDYIDLQKIHEISPDTSTLPMLRGTDQSTVFHRCLYDTFNQSRIVKSEFYIAYLSLSLNILSFLKEHPSYLSLDTNWLVQRFPTIRYQFPGSISVFEFHKDSDYGHPCSEVNCFYALTDCINTCALQVEQTLGCSNYEPLNLQSGQYALLNTSVFRHGDVVNQTNNTRVSIDFRFTPDTYLDSTTSLTQNRKFTKDDYFMSETDILTVINESAE